MICNHLEAVSRGEITKLVVNVPPGHAKTTIVCMIWPLWEMLILGRNDHYAAVSFDANLTRDAGANVLKVLRSGWAKALGGREYVKRESAASDFHTLPGGRYFTTSTGGKITGRHFSRMIIDDPTKPASATATSLQEAQDRWSNTLRTRVKPDGAFVLIMQRLADTDLAGYLLESGEWVHVRLPLQAKGERCVTRWGADERKDGAILWPGRGTDAHWASLRRDLGPLTAAAQLDQDPVPDGGAIFKAEWFKRGKPPGNGRKVISVDCTFKEEPGSDFVSMHVWVQCGPNFYLTDRVHERLGFRDTLTRLRGFCGRHRDAERVLVEKAANGHAVLDVLSAEIPGIEGVIPDGGKVARAQAISGYAESGNIFLPEGTDGDEVQLEASRFPRGKNDDDVDAMSQGVRYLATTGGGLLDWANY
jgi:predicted phage terminase large subunit-like protein